MSPIGADDAALLQAAIEVRRRAYVPYSRFAVGAALRCADAKTYVGANVENCSYGLTLCAERAALVQAVAGGSLPAQRLVCIVVVTEAPRLSAPCGACRQVLAEFAHSQARLIMHNLRDGQQQVLPLAELLPHAFLPDSL